MSTVLDDGLRVDASIVIYRLHDVGEQVDLDRATECLAARGPVRQRPARPEAQALVIASPPVVAALGSAPLTIAGFALEGTVTASVFDFAVVSLRLELTLATGLPWSSLLEFARSTDLVRAAAPVLDTALARLLESLKPAIDRPQLAEVTEDYIVYRVDALRDRGGEPSPSTALRDEDLAPLLLGEQKPLAASALRELLLNRFSYYADDLAILGWYGSLIIEPDRDDIDVQYVLEFANAQLLELRVYDEMLHRELPKLHDRIEATRHSSFAMLGRRFGPLLGDLQGLVADVTETVERAENAFKVTDDVYLARIYSAALEIFRARAWRAGIDRKLGILRDTYTMLSEESRAARSEALELAIVLLIVAEIVLSLIR
jgi:hypothetical protein